MKVVDGHGEVVGGVQEAGIRVHRLTIIRLQIIHSTVCILESRSTFCDALQVTDGESGPQGVHDTNGQNARQNSLQRHAARCVGAGISQAEEKGADSHRTVVGEGGRGSRESIYSTHRRVYDTTCVYTLSGGGMSR